MDQADLLLKSIDVDHKAVVEVKATNEEWSALLTAHTRLCEILENSTNPLDRLGAACGIKYGIEIAESLLTQADPPLFQDAADMTSTTTVPITAAALVAGAVSLAAFASEMDAAGPMPDNVKHGEAVMRSAIKTFAEQAMVTPASKEN
jgi:hypothetical protein